MPTWGEILKELDELKRKGDPAFFDRVRRKYLTKAFELTRRETVLYATKWTQGGADPELLSITDEDIQALMENLHSLKGPDLDFIIHSPGGSAEAVEAIVSYLRSKFNHIRVIVPQQAMSAATMLACAANVIVMGKHSFLGPIDPQIILPTQSDRAMVVAAWAVLEQFKNATKECQDPKKMAAWLPLLAQYPPGLLVQCQHAIDLSVELVQEWLAKFMFGGDRNARRNAKTVAKKLSKHSLFKSHARHISRDKAEALGLKIQKLECNQEEQDIFLSIFHATTHTFDGTSAVKIMENHIGKAFIKQQQRQVIQIPFAAPSPPPVTIPSPPPGPQG